MENKQAILMLEDESVYRGTAFGFEGTAGGELCFNTGMTGYQEVFTDPSYTGQVLIMNNVHIGNYGIKNEDVESDGVKISALIGRNLGEHYSRTMADFSLQEYLVKNKIVAINNIDTRALVNKVRTAGAMNCIISSEILDESVLKKKLQDVPSMKGLELASTVSTKATYELGDKNVAIRVAVLDYGVKRNILKCMTDRGAYLKVFPAKTAFAELKNFNPTGYFLSNGPGDPAAMEYANETIQEILNDGKPLFGICLGHQLLAQACGITTYKMHHGHRGLNHPVKNLQTGKAEITTQNHGFGVVAEDVEKNNKVEVTHVNLNDKSIEGIKLKDKPAFSVQYHPEATPGPHDSRYLFDDFIAMMRK